MHIGYAMSHDAQFTCVQGPTLEGSCHTSLCEMTTSYEDSVWSWTFALKNAVHFNTKVSTWSNFVLHCLEEKEFESIATSWLCTLAILFSDISSLFGYKRTHIWWLGDYNGLQLIISRVIMGPCHPYIESLLTLWYFQHVSTKEARRHMNGGRGKSTMTWTINTCCQVRYYSSHTPSSKPVHKPKWNMEL